MTEQIIDNVNQPKHYCSHPSGIECIQIAEFLPFNLGNALKYLWRSDLKWDKQEDTRKAIFYLHRQTALGKAPLYTYQEVKYIKKLLDDIWWSKDSRLHKIISDIAFGTKEDWLALADDLEGCNV
mgnify:CR=1 FL=1